MLIKKFIIAAVIACAACAPSMPANAQERVVVVEAAPAEPPAPVVETIVVAPAPNYVWTGGHWYWNSVGWVWVSGHYVRVVPGFHWVRSHYVAWGPWWARRWHYVPGHWAR